MHPGHYVNLEEWNEKTVEGDDGIEQDRDKDVVLFVSNKSTERFWREKVLSSYRNSRLSHFTAIFSPQKSSLWVVHQLKTYFSRNRFILMNSGIWCFLHTLKECTSNQTTWSKLKSFIGNSSVCGLLFSWKDEFGRCQSRNYGTYRSICLIYSF